MAVYRHYSVFQDIINKPPIFEAHTITFVEQTSFNCLNTCEDKWLNKLNAQIKYSKHDPSSHEIMINVGYSFA